MQHDNIPQIKEQCWYDPLRLLQTLCPNRLITPSHNGWRIGKKGSLSVRNDGCWYCHEAGAGGDIIDLISYALAVDFKGALMFAKSYIGQVSLPYNPSKPPAPAAQKAESAKRQAKARALWNKAQPIDGGAYDNH